MLECSGNPALAGLLQIPYRIMFLILFLILLPRIKTEPLDMFPYRGVYLSAYAASKLDRYLAYIRETEINCVVVDFKETEGFVFYNTNVEFVETIGANRPILNLETLIEQCKKEGIRLVGRVVVFRDSVLAYYMNGKYSLKNPDGRIWTDGHGDYWVDPCSKEVWSYNAEIVKDLASRGVSEIQLDYIRFPSASGDFKPFRLNCDNKETTIAEFLAFVHKKIEALPATCGRDFIVPKLSGAVFGYTLQRPLRGEGQNLKQMAPSLDVICPMLYPSHFAPQDDWNPFTREQEYNLVFKSIISGELLINEFKFVPYIQGFKLKTSGFGPEYIANQMDAVRDSKAWGYIIWNPAGKYDALWQLENRD